MVNKKSEDYKQGKIDGYSKGLREAKRICKEGNKHVKEIRKALNKLREYF